MWKFLLCIQVCRFNQETAIYTHLLIESIQLWQTLLNVQVLSLIRSETRPALKDVNLLSEVTAASLRLCDIKSWQRPQVTWMSSRARLSVPNSFLHVKIQPWGRLKCNTSKWPWENRFVISCYLASFLLWVLLSVIEEDFQESEKHKELLCMVTWSWASLYWGLDNAPNPISVPGRQESCMNHLMDTKEVAWKG